LVRNIINESKRFKTFVANRVAHIRSYISPSQWRYIETSQNPGDDVSRGIRAEQILTSKRWISGPYLLWNDIHEPNAEVPALSDNCEVKKCQVLATVAGNEDSFGVDRLLKHSLLGIACVGQLLGSYA
jgi:hypothetical protein